MSLRSSGLYCDICNQPMLVEMFFEHPVIGFRFKCSPDLLHCHNDCEPLLTKVRESLDETILPHGPIRDLLTRVKAHNEKLEAE